MAQNRGCEYEPIMFDTYFYQCNNNPWTLVFQDEFTDDTLDISKWELQPWGQGGLYGDPGKPQEYNTLSNAIIRNGILNIIAKRDTIIEKAINWLPADTILEDGLPNLRPYYYTSSNIWTKYQFYHGKFEARIKIPRGKGFWPAFWTYRGNPWNEIDIFEFWNEYYEGLFCQLLQTSRQHLTVHYDYDNDGNTNMCNTTHYGVDCSQDFHIYSMTWEEDKIQWFIDGELIRTDYRRYSILAQEIGCDIFDNTIYLQDRIYPVDPMHIILNLAIQYGENGCESPDGNTIFPNQMEIDWVRYYQRNKNANISITDYNQFTLDSTLYNVIVGKNININCTYNIQADYLLNMIASESIVFGPGFHSAVGSRLYAKIETNIFGSSSRDTNLQDSFATNIISNGNMVSDTDRFSDINIYPNPNNGNFIIDCGEYGDNNTYDICVTNVYGEIVLKYENYQASTFTIDMTNNNNGIYIVNVYDRTSNIYVYKKIIVQR